MKIHFGNALTDQHIVGAVLLGCTLYGIGWFNMELISLLDESEESILHSRGLNVTRVSIVFNCYFPYDNCLCSNLSKKTNTSETCVTYNQLVGSRILPLISFFLQICLARQLFSLSGDYRHVIIFVLWIACIFTFIGMIISISWSSCYQAYISYTLFGTAGILFFLSFHNFMTITDGIRSSHDTKIVPVYGSKRNDKVSIGWKELPWTNIYFFPHIWLRIRLFVSSSFSLYTICILLCFLLLVMLSVYHFDFLFLSIWMNNLSLIRRFTLLTKKGSFFPLSFFFHLKFSTDSLNKQNIYVKVIDGFLQTYTWIIGSNTNSNSSKNFTLCRQVIGWMKSCKTGTFYSFIEDLLNRFYTWFLSRIRNERIAGYAKRKNSSGAIRMASNGWECPNSFFLLWLWLHI
jgi:hypothetical protein